MTQEELEGSLKHWQKVLRLQDWEITVHLVRKHEMKMDDCGGCVEFLHGKKRADIQILCLEDHKETWEWKPDQELSLVHELVHLHIGTFYDEPEDGTREWRFYEQAIHALSLALMEQSRGSE